MPPFLRYEFFLNLKKNFTYKNFARRKKVAAMCAEVLYKLTKFWEIWRKTHSLRAKNEFCLHPTKHSNESRLLWYRQNITTNGV